MPVFIAHRGEAASYPENTIAALRGAVAADIKHLEFDIQLSADLVPVLAHDRSLTRTAGVDRLISAGLASELTAIAVGEAARFGNRFADERLPSLAQALQALDSADELTLFVELKRESLRTFGRRRVLSAVLPVLATTRHTIVLISFDYTVLVLAGRLCEYAVGWVLSHYNGAALKKARALSPAYLFCNLTRLPASGDLWRGSWQWAVYEVTELDQARALMARGVNCLESMRAAQLSRSFAQEQARKDV